MEVVGPVFKHSITYSSSIQTSSCSETNSLTFTYKMGSLDRPSQCRIGIASYPSPISPMNDQKMQRAMRSCVILCLSASLAACGGGGGGDSDITSAAAPASVVVATPIVAEAPNATTDRSQSSPAPAPAPAPVPVPVPVPVTADKDSCGLNGANGIQSEIMSRVNALRASGAVCGSTLYRATGPLNWSNVLLQAASAHSNDMASKNFFSHVGSAGSTMVTRIAATGYGFSAAGENIAAGQPTVEAAMRSWINSPGHCQNLMNPTYKDVAVACKRNDASSYGKYWTMVLGSK